MANHGTGDSSLEEFLKKLTTALNTNDVADFIVLKAGTKPHILQEEDNQPSRARPSKPTATEIA